MYSTQSDGEGEKEGVGGGGGGGTDRSISRVLPILVFVCFMQVTFLELS